MKDRLVFVYNADSGFVNTVIDHLHKRLSPDTYACRLCQLTFEGFTMAPAWKAFLDSLDAETEFHHVDTFRKAYGALGEKAPVLFRRTDGGLVPILRASEFASLHSLDELIDAVRKATAR
jgi:hypothetical protein